MSIVKIRKSKNLIILLLLLTVTLLSLRLYVSHHTCTDCTLDKKTRTIQKTAKHSRTQFSETKENPSININYNYTIDQNSDDEEDDDNEPDRYHSLPGSDRLINYKFPILFIGGVPRSGTTIMRVIVDAHPLISCGEETRVVPQIISSRRRQAVPIEKARLLEAGITQKLLNKITREYVLSVLVRKNTTLEMKPNVEMLCDKDPFNLMGTSLLKQMFPNSKFILMIRDGRAVAHSIITRKISIRGWDLNSYKDVLSKWSTTTKTFLEQCDSQPPGICLPVYYEQLVLQPNKTIRKIAHFLNVPWNEAMLHHQEAIGKSISLSKLERSTDQVAKPINILGLNSWVGNIPDSIHKHITWYAPMLEKLGYDLSREPYYGEPDEFVKENLRLIKSNPSMYKVETQEWMKGKVIKATQYGAEEMEKRQHLDSFEA